MHGDRGASLRARRHLDRAIIDAWPPYLALAATGFAMKVSEFLAEREGETVTPALLEELAVELRGGGRRAA